MVMGHAGFQIAVIRAKYIFINIWYTVHGNKRTETLRKTELFLSQIHSRKGGSKPKEEDGMICQIYELEDTEVS